MPARHADVRPALGGQPESALKVLAHCMTGHLRQLTTRVTHILPVSDDGGSTAEIVRVLGGPAVGDIRSRCLRLADDADAEVQPPSMTRQCRRTQSGQAASPAHCLPRPEGRGRKTCQCCMASRLLHWIDHALD